MLFKQGMVTHVETVKYDKKDGQAVVGFAKKGNRNTGKSISFKVPPKSKRKPEDTAKALDKFMQAYGISSGEELADLLNYL